MCKVGWKDTVQHVSSLDGCTWNKLYHDNEGRLPKEKMLEFYTVFMNGTGQKITIEDPAVYAKMLDQNDDQSNNKQTNEAKAIIDADLQEKKN